MTSDRRDERLKHLKFAGRPAGTDRRPPRAASRRAAPATRPAMDRPGAAADMHQPFIAWLFARAGLDVTMYRPAPLARRLPACLRALRVASTDAARALLEARPQLLQVAISAFLLGVTEFFRDPAVFDELRLMLPPLAATTGRLRIWSVASADGSELYSVGILLAELGLLNTSELLGTDCRPEAVEQARAARYLATSLVRVAPPLLERYFEPEGSHYRLPEGFRSRARFIVQDFGSQVEPGPWDLILWRNTAIYLEPAVARDVWRRLVEQLRPGGVLVTGRAERPAGVTPLQRVAACIYRRGQP